MSGVAKKLMGTTAAGGGGFTAIEDVFSTYLYTGNGSTQTITNGIDLDGEGGLVWLKRRDNPGFAVDHVLMDSERGVSKILYSNSTSLEISTTWGTSFNSDGFNFTTASGLVNGSGGTYASWTFRKAPRFFDVVTYTGNSTSGRTIAHNLGVTPGFIVVKRTNLPADWIVLHRNDGTTSKSGWLNYTDSFNNRDVGYFPADPNDTDFYLSSSFEVNRTGDTYVAYLFAHDPLGPSGDGSDGLIACGSYTGNGSDTAGPVVDLGWEPQFVIVKRASGTSDWLILDTMRGMSHTSVNLLRPNTSGAELAIADGWFRPSPTGFQVMAPGQNDANASGSDYIYIAIRRGPMRAPESGTEVFDPEVGGASVANNALVTTTGFPVDMFMHFDNYTSGGETFVVDRLRGRGVQLRTQYTATEATYGTNDPSLDSNEGLINRSGSTQNESGGIFWSFRRAPEFFDVVAYTGDNVDQRQVSHNLSAPPEFIITKTRNVTDNWICYHTGLTVQNFSGADYADTIVLNSSVAEFQGLAFRDSTAQTEDYMTLGFGGTSTNESGKNYIAYLFATLAGVSKVGSYTGNGTSQTINCGFTTGARFVLIKKSSGGSSWYVFDTARGITVNATDGMLQLNSTLREYAESEWFGENAISPSSLGFIVTSALSESGASYIFYAIS